HKADLPGAERVEAQVLASLALGSGPAVPVVRVSSRTGEGMSRLWDTIASLPLRRGVRVASRDLLRRAQDVLAARSGHGEQTGERQLQAIVDEWRGGAAEEERAAARLLSWLAGYCPPAS